MTDILMKMGKCGHRHRHAGKLSSEDRDTDKREDRKPHEL